MILPPINTKGRFTFATPFDAILDSSQEYKVVSIRSLLELHNSQEEPCDTIYKAVGLTDADFQEDLNTNIPIIVLTTTGGEYIHIPADRILSMPDVTGIKYRGAVIAVNLGLLPLDYDYTLVKQIITDDILAACGIKSTAEIVPSTAITMLTEIEDVTFKQTLEAAKTVNSSYKTRYLLLQEAHVKQTQLLEELSVCIKNSCTKTNP